MELQQNIYPSDSRIFSSISPELKYFWMIPLTLCSSQSTTMPVKSKTLISGSIKRIRAKNLSVHHRHGHIEQYQVDLIIIVHKDFNGFIPIGRVHYGISGVLQFEAGGVVDEQFVFGDQNGARRGGYRGS